MNKVRDDFDVITYETDSILYYNPEDLYDSETKEKIKEACEKGRKEGMEKGRLEASLTMEKKLKKLNIPLYQISEVTNISVDDLKNI